MKGERGLLIKTLFQTGTRVSEFVNIKVEDVFFEEQMILIAKAKGGKSRYVPILPELAQELRTHVGQRTVGFSLRRIAPRVTHRGASNTLSRKRRSRRRSPSGCTRIFSGIRWQQRS